MNLNKYHPSGREYTTQESRTRAMALFRQRFVVKEPRKPYDIGRNAKKRAAVVARANLLRGTQNV
jgi:hypothetical protein